MRAVLVAFVLAAASRPALAKFNWAGQVAADAQGLTDIDPDVRKKAVAALAADDITLAEPYLLGAATDDADAEVREAAASALGTGGSQAAVPLMTKWLATGEPKLQAIAAEVLGNIGGPVAMTAVIRSLGDPEWSVRLKAVQALGKIGRRGGSVVIALIPRLEDDKSDIKVATIRELEQLGDRRAVIPLVARFSDNSVEVRQAAVKAVGKLGDGSAAPALIRIARSDNNPNVRAAAVTALGVLGAVDAIDTLAELLRTGDQSLRDKCAVALGQIAAAAGAGTAGEDAMVGLVDNLNGSPSEQAAATEALQLAGHAAVPALVGYLRGHTASDPTKAVGLLALAADPRATAALTAELDRGRVAIPLLLRALGATHDPAALVPVLGALAHDDPAIRLAAMEALRPLIGSDARAGDVLVEHLADASLDVRVLAAQYLGQVGATAATAKLTALVGPGNPPRLRLAAIEALGGIGAGDHTASATRAFPDAAKALLDVLRAGPPQLARPAATSLAYLAEPTALAPLLQLARDLRGGERDQVIRALGRTLHAKPDEPAQRLLVQLATDGDRTTSAAAIAAIAASGDHSAPTLSALRAMAAHASGDQRRGAAWALGELHDGASADTLVAALSTSDDRLAADAAWALGELAAAAPGAARTSATAERLLYVSAHGGWASAIDASGALARALWAAAPNERAAIVPGTLRAQVGALALHKSRLARVHAALALSALAAAGDADAVTSLTRLAHDDASPHVRAAAVAGLVRSGVHTDAIAAALKLAATDGDLRVRAAAAAADHVPPRTDWCSFYVVRPNADDAAVVGEPYFLPTADGLVWASYTDARGELTSEHVTSGDDVPLAKSAEADY